MNHFTIPIESDRVIEVCCCQPGPRDGALLGYAILFAGSWDGWQLDEINHRLMRKVAIGVDTSEEAIKAIVGEES